MYIMNFLNLNIHFKKFQLKVLLLLIFLVLTSQQFSKADDIKNFQIEGISIGDSLLKHFNKKEILSNTIADYNSKTFVRFIPNIGSVKLETYDSINFHYKQGSEFEIYEISGGIIYNNHEKCKKKLYQVSNEIESILDNFNKIDRGTKPFYDVDSSGNSIVTSIVYEKKSIGYIWVACYDYSSEIENNYNWSDSLRISVNNTEFQNWLDGPAYE